MDPRYCRYVLTAIAVLPFANDAHAADVGTAFTYQGFLEKPAGTPLTDTCTFEFKLCDDAAAACAPGTISDHPGVAVTDGVFTVADVDFGAGAFTGDARWMEVYVQCTGNSGLVALSPRVELTPAPYSLRAGEGVGGPNALNVTPDGDVGIGTNSPAAMLHVAGDVRVDGALQAGSISSETPLQIQTDGTTRIFVDDFTGAVGIGTSGPFEPGPDTFGFRETFLPSARYGLSCAADPSSKEIFCFGGVLVLGNEQQMTDQIIRFDPDSDNVTVMASVLPTARSGTSCAWSDATQRVYCFGGYDWEAGYTYLDQIVSFDPASGSLTNQSAVLPTERAYPSCAVDAGTGKIYCFGGFYYTGQDSVYLNDIVEYDPTLDAIAVKSATLPSGLNGLDVACTSGLAGKLYCVVIGYDNPSWSKIIEYTPATDTLIAVPSTYPGPARINR